ncbi:MAG: ABC transporter substrate-binding protein [Janthinobacterium lividum]
MNNGSGIVRKSVALGGAFALSLLAGTALAQPKPIKIGVIAEAQAISGASISKAAQLAADEINEKGGVDGRKVEIIVYDDHSSAADAVRAFQRAVSEDHVNVVIASYISEVVLALEPWAGRLKTVMITPGAASDVITANIKKDYDHLKYTFQGYLTSTSLSGLVCDAGKTMMVDGLHAKTAVIMSEDAAWTTPLDAGYEACLPKIGIKVLDHVRFSPDTTDFTPIYNKIESSKPDIIVTGISHVGVQPTVQWKNQQVPMPMFGISSQATNATFWNDTNGAASGVLFQSISGPGVAITPRTIPFVDAYTKRFGAPPSYAGYTAYDQVFYLTEAIKRAGSDDQDKLVEALEKTDYQGVIGQTKFTGKDTANPHTLVTGPGGIEGLFLQWQDGKQVNLWPNDLSKGKVQFPSFVKINSAQ